MTKSQRERERAICIMGWAPFFAAIITSTTFFYCFYVTLASLSRKREEMTCCYNNLHEDFSIVSMTFFAVITTSTKASLSRKKRRGDDQKIGISARKVRAKPHMDIYINAITYTSKSGEWILYLLNLDSTNCQFGLKPLTWFFIWYKTRSIIGLFEMDLSNN